MKNATVNQMKKKSEHHAEELERQVEVWRTKYLRALADYQNLEKRKSDEIQEIRRFAGEYIIVRLLPIVDTFEKALKHIQDQGMSLALKQLYTFLEEQDVYKIDVVGKSFNPSEMECIEVVDGKDESVLEEILSGYTLNGKIIRVAKVKVGKKMMNAE